MDNNNTNGMGPDFDSDAETMPLDMVENAPDPTSDNVTSEAPQEAVPTEGAPQAVVPDAPQQYQQMNNFTGQYQQAMGNQPVQMPAQTPGKKVKKVKKPWSKGKIAAVVGGCTVGVAAIALAVIFLIVPLFKPAKDIVVDAFENTFSMEANQSYLVETFATDEIIDKILESGGDISFGVAVNSVDGVEMDTLAIDLTNSYDPVNKLINMGVILEYAEQALLTLNLYGDETNTYLELPDLFNAYFSFKNDDLLGGIEESYIGSLVDLSALESIPPLSLNYFPDMSEEGTEVSSDVVAAIEELWDNVEVEKDGKKKIEVSGETIKAKKYIVTFGEENIEEALTDVMNYAISELAADPEYLASMNMDAATFEAYAATISSYVPMLVAGDLKANIYIYKDKVVKIELDDDVNMLGTTIEYDCFFDLYDGDEELQIELSVSAMGEAGESIGMYLDIDDYATAPTGSYKVVADGETAVININSTREETDAQTVFNSKITPEGSENYIEVGYVYDKNAMTFTANGKVYDANSNETYGVDIAGAYVGVEKGVKFGVKLDKIALTTNDQVVAEASAYVTMDSSANSATAIDSSVAVYDFVNMSDVELQNLILDNMDNIMDWAESVEDALGDLISLTGLDQVNQTEAGDKWDEEPTEEPEEPTYSTSNTISTADGTPIMEVFAEFNGLSVTFAMNDNILYNDDSGANNVEYSYHQGITDPTEITIEWWQDPIETNVNGVDLQYTSWKTNDFPNSTQYRVLRDLGDGDMILMQAVLDDNMGITVDDLLSAMTDASTTVLK